MAVEPRSNVGQEIQRTLDAIWARLDAAELEPALSRRGEPALLTSAAELTATLERDAIAKLAELRAELTDTEQQLESYGVATAYCAAALAGLRFLGGEASEASADLKRAASLAPPSELGDLLNEGALDPEAFIGLLYAQWLMRRERVADARRCASALLRRKLDTETARCARQIAEIPEPLRPLSSAPALFRFNGCGVALFGQRDVRADGSYLATRYLTLLFVPIFPLDAFRVTRENQGYRFYGKVMVQAIVRSPS